MNRPPTVAASVLALTLVGCRGPTPAPTPLNLDRARIERVPSRPPASMPKFDVAPPGPTQRPDRRPPPKGLVEVANVDATIRIDMRYATADNFTGAPLPGYLPGAAWLTTAAADALAAVQRDLAEEGLGLLIYDAYRPLRATRAMVAWAEQTEHTQLLDDGYIGRASNHNRGNTVDLTLVTLHDGKEVDMGTPWDTFGEASGYAAAHGDAMRNRKRLRLAMMKRGFGPYDKEWWHFTLPSEPEPPPLDVSYAQ